MEHVHVRLNRRNEADGTHLHPPRQCELLLKRERERAHVKEREMKRKEELCVH